MFSLERNDDNASSWEKQEIVYTFNVLVFKQILTSSYCLLACCYCLLCIALWIAEQIFHLQMMFFIVFIWARSSHAPTAGCFCRVASKSPVSFWLFCLSESHIYWKIQYLKIVFASSSLWIQARVSNKLENFLVPLHSSRSWAFLSLFSWFVSVPLKHNEISIPWNVPFPKKSFFLSFARLVLFSALPLEAKRLKMSLCCLAGQKCFDGRPGTDTRAAY